MAGDLERFLQQAAERLKQKMEQGNKPPPAQRPQQAAPPVRKAERQAQSQASPPRYEPVVEAEIVRSSRQQGPNPLSELDTRKRAETDVDFADERMSDHVHDVFDHDVSHLQQASSALSGGGQSSQGSQVKTRQHDVSPLVEMLRDPKTLRSAFIASEIFSRKF